MKMKAIRHLYAALCCLATVAAAQSVTPSDISIVLTASPTTAYPGTDIDLHGNVHNKGPDPCTSVTVQSILPNRLLPLSATSTSGNVVITDQQIDCTIPILEPETTASLHVQARLSGTGRGFTTATMTARSSESADPNPSDNESTQAITILWPIEADVGVSGTAVDGEVTLSEGVVLNLTTSCYGPDTASSITSSLLLPEELQLVRATTSSNSIVTTSSGHASFYTASLDPRESAKHMVFARPQNSGSFTVYWQIFSSGGGDWNSMNNHTVFEITVLPGPSRAGGGWESYP